MKLRIMAALTLAILSVQGAFAKNDFIFWNATQLEVVKKSYANKETSYKSAVDKLVKDAEAELDKPEPSVIDKPMTPASGDKRDYMSMGRYWWPDPSKPDGLPYIRKDGHSNPELKKFDRDRIGAMSTSVVRLTLAYYMTGKAEYARKATAITRKWFLNSKTRMNPNMNFGQTIPGRDGGKGRAEGVLDTYSLIPIPDALQILADAKYISKKDFEAYKAWFAEYATWMVESEIGKAEQNAKNNHGLAYDVQLAVFASFAAKTDLAAETINGLHARRIFLQVEPDGKQPLELARTTGFGYSVFNITHMLDMCDIARNHNMEIYKKSSDGRSISAAINYLTPFLGEQQSFPYQQINSWEKVQHDFAEQLYRAWKISNTSSYKKLYNQYKPTSVDYMFRILYY